MNTGKDVTDQFDITVQGTKAPPSAKASYPQGIEGIEEPEAGHAPHPRHGELRRRRARPRSGKDFGRNAETNRLLHRPERQEFGPTAAPRP